MNADESRAGGPSTSVSVIVPTRNRPHQIRACVDSVLANHDLLELVVVDQSDDASTEDELAGVEDGRLHYVRVDSRGVTAARNHGVRLSVGSIVAFTDDDCRVPEGWVEALRDLFAAEPRAAVVCGNVTVPEDLLEDGFAASFHPVQREVWRSMPKMSEWGITANMAIRRWVFDAVGMFDEMLGAGSPLGSGGEQDFLFRVLRAGLLVVNASEIDVTHLGIRPYGPETRALWLRYCAGTSAAFFKHVRLGDPVAVALYGRYLVAMSANVAKNVVTGQRPIGFRILPAFAQGARNSMRFAVDRRSRLYAAR